MKTYIVRNWTPRYTDVWGSGVIAPRIPNMYTKWRWMVSFTTRPLYPQGKSPCYPLDMRLGEPQSWSGRSGEEEKTPSLAEIQLVSKSLHWLSYPRNRRNIMWTMSGPNLWTASGQNWKWYPNTGNNLEVTGPRFCRWSSTCYNAFYGFRTQPHPLRFHGEMASLLYHVNVPRCLVIDLLAVSSLALATSHSGTRLENPRVAGGQEIQLISFLTRNVFDISRCQSTWGVLLTWPYKTVPVQEIHYTTLACRLYLHIREWRIQPNTGNHFLISWGIGNVIHVLN
jgi:hypothetical protein